MEDVDVIVMKRGYLVMKIKINEICAKGSDETMFD